MAPPFSTEKDGNVTQHLKKKYGEGKVTEEICTKCSKKFECLSAGIYASNSGLLQHYADDCQLCDICIKDEEWYTC